MMNYVRTFVTWDQIQTQQTEMKLFNEKTRAVLTQYSTEHEQHKEMIRRFDEVISTKINKECFEKFLKQCEDQLQTKSDSDVSYREIKESLFELEQGLIRESVSKQQLMHEVVKQTERLTAKIVDNKLEQYQSVVTQFHKFFSSDSLQEQLNQKAETKKVQALFYASVSKKDLEGLVLNSKDMFEKLRSMSILNVEMAKSLRSVQTSATTNVKVLQQLDFLVKQAEMTMNKLNTQESLNTFESQFMETSVNFNNSTGQISKLQPQNATTIGSPEIYNMHRRTKSQSIQKRLVKS